MSSSESAAAASPLTRLWAAARLLSEATEGSMARMRERTCTAQCGSERTRFEMLAKTCGISIVVTGARSSTCR